MKKSIAVFLVCGIVLTALLLTGCQPAGKGDGKELTTRTVVELNESNYWKYFAVSCDMKNDLNAGGKGRVGYDIEGVLDYALYEDVVFTFEVIYYTDGQKEEEYQSYAMRIGCNAAGDAKFETDYLGLTDVTVGKLLGTDGELVSLENYNWKLHFISVTGKVIYNQ